MRYREVPAPRTKRRQTKLVKRELQKQATPFCLDPARLYEYEVDTILRALARWIARRDYAPTAKMLAYSKNWRQHALQRYLDDMQATGLVRVLPGGSYTLTDAGFAAVGYEPVVPHYPTNRAARDAQKRAERRAASLQQIVQCHANAVNP